MKKLSKKITKKGFVYEEMKRIKDIAIYKQTSADPLIKCTKYEAIKIKSHNGMTLGGNYIPPAEVYPSSTQWGILGFTCDNMEDAEIRFKQLSKTKE